MTEKQIRPDRVIIADRVHTVDPANPLVEAVAIKGRSIIAVGSRGDVAEWDLSEAEVINLPGATVTPGLVDAHTHPLSGAESGWRAVDLFGASTLEEIRRRVAAHVQTAEPGEWVRGVGMPFDAFVDIPVSNSYFEDLLGGRPAVLRFFDGHASIASKEALRLAGIVGAIDFGNNSRIVVDEQGEPTGYLIEGDAISLVMDQVPLLTSEERKLAVRDALEGIAASGYTQLHALDFDESHIDVLQALEDEGELPLRIRISPIWLSSADWKATFKRFVELQGFGGRRWKIEGVKLMLDGTVDNGSAWLYEADVEGGGTVPYWVPSELFTETVHALAQNGIPTATHAIGDRAVDFVLDAIQSAPDCGTDLVHRIEHIETIPDSIVPRFKELGVAASMQPMHVLSTKADRTDMWSTLLGRETERAGHGWRIKDIWDTGAIVALGSDWPVEIFDARQVFATNLNRKRPFGVDAPVGPDQSVSARDTLQQFTQQVWASIGQPSQGMIRVGALADFTIFAADPLELEPDDLAGVTVLMTVVNGQVAHRDVSLSS